MRIISKSRLKEFWRKDKDPKQAEKDLLVWHRRASKGGWTSFAELKQTFPSADQVGNCTVFDVGNNRYRLIGRVRYASGRALGRVYVLRVMDHKEYDTVDWEKGCGCHKPPPKYPRRS
jgi:mRNA interferase HigB